MMTTGEMLAYTNRFNEIMSSNLSQDFKDRMLANFMTELERTYRISMIPRLNEKLEREHPYIMQLYRTVSDARVL